MSLAVRPKRAAAARSIVTRVMLAPSTQVVRDVGVERRVLEPFRQLLRPLVQLVAVLRAQHVQILRARRAGSQVDVLLRAQDHLEVRESAQTSAAAGRSLRSHPRRGRPRSFSAIHRRPPEFSWLLAGRPDRAARSRRLPDRRRRCAPSAGASAPSRRRRCRRAPAWCRDRKPMSCNGKKPFGTRMKPITATTTVVPNTRASRAGAQRPGERAVVVAQQRRAAPAPYGRRTS